MFFREKNVVISYFFFLLFIISFSSCKKNSKFIPQESKNRGAFFDLSQIDFEKHNENIELRGKWEFYWKKLLKTNSNPATRIPYDTLVNCPSIWTKYKLDNKFLSPFGYATYRCVVKLKPSQRPLAVLIHRQGHAYKLFINGELITECGKVATTKEETKHKLLSSLAYFTPQKSENEIVLQIANFDHEKGGFRDKFIIGNAQSVRNLYINSA